MRKGSIAVIVIVVIALMAIGGLTYYALAPKPTASPSPIASVAIATATPTPTPSKTSKFTAGMIVFTLPEGWKETSTIASDVEGHHTFANATTGDFIKVSFFSGGIEGNSDVFWDYSLGGEDSKSFVLTGERPDCNSEGMCQKGDGQLNIGALLNGLPENKLDGRYYAIYLGNTKSETADRQTYRDIMKAARIR